MRGKLATAVLVLATTFLLASAVPAQDFVPPEALTPDPDMNYAVRNIAFGDQLQVGYQPGKGVSTSGSLAHDARGIAVTGRRITEGSTVWWEVILPDRPGRTGWVDHRFLGADPHTSPGPTTHPLMCSGSEPLWSLRLVNRDAFYSEPGEKPLALTASGWIRSRNNRDVFIIRLRGKRWPQTDEGHATLRKTSCTTGFYSLDYPYEATVFLPFETVLDGCCSRLATP